MIFRRNSDDSSSAESGRLVLIGLTGPIGCGKSTIARMLGDVGGVVIDADALAREVTAPGADALREIRERFGDAVFQEDELDRARLAEVVFSDNGELQALEAIIHPRVRKLVDERLRQATQEGVPFVVIEAIKLVEGGLANRCDEVWLVTCERDSQRQRLALRGDDADDIERRIAAQGPDLIERLENELRDQGVPVRRLATDAAVQETREQVENMLAAVLDQYW